MTSCGIRWWSRFKTAVSVVIINFPEFFTQSPKLQLEKLINLTQTWVSNFQPFHVRFYFSFWRKKLQKQTCFFLPSFSFSKGIINQYSGQKINFFSLLMMLFQPRRYHLQIFSTIYCSFLIIYLIVYTLVCAHMSTMNVHVWVRVYD